MHAYACVRVLYDAYVVTASHIPSRALALTREPALDATGPINVK